MHIKEEFEKRFGDVTDQRRKRNYWKVWQAAWDLQKWKIEELTRELERLNSKVG